MRRQIFEAITYQLTQELPDIQHIDLWNQNVEFIEQENVFPMPAVFVEFAPIQWRRIQNSALKGIAVEADVILHLHVVTQAGKPTYNGSLYREEGLKVFDLLDDIAYALYYTDYNGIKRLERTASSTNHNHEEIREDIETYQLHVVGRL